MKTELIIASCEIIRMTVISAKNVQSKGAEREYRKGVIHFEQRTRKHLIEEVIFGRFKRTAGFQQMNVWSDKDI